LSTLRNLAASLGIPVFRFFLPVESEAVQVVRRAERMSIGLARTGPQYQLLTPSVHSQLEVMQITLEPGQDSAPELMNHAGEECW
jgi:hypothetical protein